MKVVDVMVIVLLCWAELHCFYDCQQECSLFQLEAESRSKGFLVGVGSSLGIVTYFQKMESKLLLRKTLRMR